MIYSTGIYIYINSKNKQGLDNQRRPYDPQWGYGICTLRVPIKSPCSNPKFLLLFCNRNSDAMGPCGPDNQWPPLQGQKKYQ